MFYLNKYVDIHNPGLKDFHKLCFCVIVLQLKTPVAMDLIVRLFQIELNCELTISVKKCQKGILRVL